MLDHKEILRFTSELGRFLSGKRIKKLLSLEKERRGKKEEELVFIGAANIAKYFWCAYKSIIKNKLMELAYFASYLMDRIQYSYILGLISEIPHDDYSLLEIGNNLTMEQIETILRSKSQESKRTIESVIVTRNGHDIVYINPFLNEEYKEVQVLMGSHIGKIAAEVDDFEIFAQFAESSIAEQYPTIRWNFTWNDFVILMIPDGITDKFVYEFKTARNRYLHYYLKPVAKTQADLYGFFFKRSSKKVQIYLKEEKEVLTYYEKVNPNRALEVLTKFQIALTEIPIPPKKWKCNSCEFKDICPLWQK